MKRTTWITRIIAVIAALLVGAGIWAAVAGTIPGRSSGRNAVTDTSFSQNDNFLTRSAPTSSAGSVPAYSAPRYRTRAS